MLASIARGAVRARGAQSTWTEANLSPNLAHFLGVWFLLNETRILNPFPFEKYRPLWFGWKRFAVFPEERLNMKPKAYGGRLFFNCSKRRPEFRARFGQKAVGHFTRKSDKQEFPD